MQAIMENLNQDNPIDHKTNRKYKKFSKIFNNINN